jgi:hypothetical protein
LLARFDDPVLAGDATVDMAEVLASGGDSAGAATLLRQAADLYRRKGATALVAVAERLLKSAVRLADGA